MHTQIAIQQYPDNRNLHLSSIDDRSIRDAVREVTDQWNWFPEQDTYLIRLARELDSRAIREWADEIRSTPDDEGWPQEFCDAVAESMGELADAVDAYAAGIREIDTLSLKGRYRLADDADTSHEDAESWWDSLGYHVSTESGDIAHPVCDLSLIREHDDDEDVLAAIIAEDELVLDEPEREGYLGVIAYGREALDVADGVAGTLDEAVTAYEARDIDAVLEALERAHRIEIEYGDSPATQTLAGQLLEQVES